jgi:hypothetical protein
MSRLLRVVMPKTLGRRITHFAGVCGRVEPFTRLCTVASCGLACRSLFEKWYAFSESPLSENCDPEIDHGMHIFGIELHCVAELCLRQGGTIHLHQTDAFPIRLLHSIARRYLQHCQSADEYKQLGHSEAKLSSISRRILSCVAINEAAP